MKYTGRSFIVWLIVGIMVIFLFNGLSKKTAYKTAEISYSKLIKLIKNNQIQQVVISGQKIKGTTKDGKRFSGIIPSNDSILKKLSNKDIRINLKPAGQDKWYYSLVITFVPFLLFMIFFIFMINKSSKGGGLGGNNVLMFGKSHARVIASDSNKITFSDVAGVEEAKDDLKEIIEFLKDPSRFNKLGGKIPKGVLLIGAPGTGKTLLAKAVAGEAQVPFFIVSGSEFVEMFVGIGASRVRDLFAKAKKSAPCIIFIDEIDAVGRRRGTGIGGGHDEREQTLNQMLVEMDGFTENEGIIVMAATNRPDVLDPALLRPGRFDRRIAVELPDIKGRKEILEVHSKNIKIAGNADLSIIAKSTPGFSGADLQNLINEAALHAASLNKENVQMEDLEFAKEKVMMGPERKSMVLSEDEKRLTAIHESGHTLIAKLLPNADPVYKVTIIPRGMAMGLTQQIPEFDRHSYSKEYLQSRLMVLLGGRAAEEVTGNSITTGAANDISQATKLVTSMVAEWGMSKLGPIHYSEDEKNPFLGQELTHTKIISDKTAENIDSEISSIINDAYRKVIKLLNDNLHKLKKLTDSLNEKETLNTSQIDEIVKKQ